MKLQLDTNKIKKYQKLYRLSKSEFALKMNISPAMVTYMYRVKPIKMATLVASFFNMDGKDFIKEIE